MLLTVSKRIDFSASRRLFSPELSATENEQIFGAESAAPYGTGRNYTAYFVFAGQPDPTTGMLINISDIKERAASIISDRYDHRYLNEDNPAFVATVPTAENIARQLLHDLTPFFSGPARLVAVHLRETDTHSATAYQDDRIEANHWFEFSAARKTTSPHLSAAENKQLFGIAVREHGHNYRVRLTFSDNSPPHDQLTELSATIRRMFDHQNLNEVAALRDKPVTTESIARVILNREAATLSPVRVRLHERDDFFAEACRDGSIFLGLRQGFSAAHRLHIRAFSADKNAELFGKCNNPRGHGHNYRVEATVGGEYDPRSGTLFSFDLLHGALHDCLAAWNYKHLDQEVPEFKAQPSTGENIVRALWQKLDSRLQQHLVRLRLWETMNNRFTLRRL